MKKVLLIALLLLVVIFSISIAYYFFYYLPQKDRDYKEAVNRCREEYLDRVASGALEGALKTIGAKAKPEELSQQYIRACLSQNGYLEKQ